jgi:hypothetical protein
VRNKPTCFDPGAAPDDYHSTEGWELTADLARDGYLVMMSDSGSEIAQRHIDAEADRWRAALYAVAGALKAHPDVPDRARIFAARKIVDAMLRGAVAR